MLSASAIAATPQAQASQELEAWLDGLPDITAAEVLSPLDEAPASAVPWLEGMLSDVSLAQQFDGDDRLEAAPPESPHPPARTDTSAFCRSGAPSPEPPFKRARASNDSSAATPRASGLDVNDIAASSRAVGMAAHLHMLQARLLEALGYAPGRQRVLVSATTLRYLIDVAFFNGVEACLSTCPRCTLAE